MKHQTDWTVLWPVAGAAVAFGVVYVISLAGGAGVGDVLIRSTGALLTTGLAGIALRALAMANAPVPQPPRPTIDITLPQTTPDETEE